MGGLVSAKFLFVLLIAMVVLGPEKLPEVARTVGRLMAEFRRVSGGLQEEVREAFGDSDLAAPVREFRAATESLRTTATGWAAPLAGAMTRSGPVAATAPTTSGTVPRTTASASGPGVLPARTVVPHGLISPAGDLGLLPGDPSLN